jgi:CubicO group peptidase (beta-lactamase class C family)
VTGKDWEVLMRERLFEPLGMKSAGFGPPGSSEKNEQPWPHSVRSGKPNPGPFIDNPSVLGPAGTVHMSPEDYGKWMLFVLKHGPKLLSDEEIEALCTSPKGSDYAFGWIRVSRGWGSGDVLSHAGSNTLNFCVAWFAPKKDFGVSVFTNVGGDLGPKVTDAVAAEIVTKMGDWRSR